MNVTIQDNASDEAQACFKITTSNATYFYQKEAGGFSSLLDADGNDWLSFQPDPSPSYPAAAATAYRGLPNLVHGGQDSGAGHPGFDKCRTYQVDERALETTSKSGHWRWRWTFFEAHAVLDMLELNPEHPYWFLYEGTPAGRYAPQHQFWATDKDGLRADKPDHFKEASAYGTWRWLYLGDERLDRVLFLAQTEKSPLDTFSFLGNEPQGVGSEDGMVVFGFGRGERATPLLGKPKTFYVGFADVNVKDPAAYETVKGRLEPLLNG